jgi:hypothetical protein
MRPKMPLAGLAARVPAGLSSRSPPMPLSVLQPPSSSAGSPMIRKVMPVIVEPSWLAGLPYTSPGAGSVDAP